MPQENLNKIWNAGKYFEPKPEQPTKEPTPDETKLSNIKRKISVVKAFIPAQEDSFKKKVEAVLKGIEEPASADLGSGEAKEKNIPADAEIVIGKGQNNIGEHLATGKSIHVLGDVGCQTGLSMSGGEIHVEGNTGTFTGIYMSGGEIYVKGNVGNGVGHFMHGGEIHVKGGAEYKTGNNMSGGEIYVEGNTGDQAGDNMSGGKIHVKGDAEDWVCNQMTGGEIHVNGNVGGWTGCFMTGGTLRIDGEVASFDESAFIPENKGTIIWKGETIWKDGQPREPGWTNLKVEEKIAG